MKHYLALACALLTLAVGAQNVVQVSGILLTSDTSLQTIPNARLWISGRPTTTT